MEHAELRRALHAQWAAVTPGWTSNAAFVDAQGAATAGAMLRSAGVRAGQRVLELACGPGGVGIAAAEIVGPQGEVVLSDVVPGMVDLAGGRAAALGLANVRARVLDLEAIDEPDGSFDAVVCRFGIMLVAQPERAAAEIARVLRPGGGAAVAVWGARARNPWLAVLFDAVGQELGITMPPEGIPGPFRLEDPGELTGVLRAGGLTEVVVEELDATTSFPSAQAWWEQVTAIAGPAAVLLASLPAQTVAAIHDRAVAAIGDGEPIQTTGLTLVAAGRRPG